MDKLIPFLIVLKDTAISIGKWIEVHNAFVAAAATLVIAAFTWALWWATRKLWKASLEQSQAMERSIAEAGRTAVSMQSIAESMVISSKAATENVTIFKDVRERQLRAYIAVGLLGVIPQDNTTNYHFEVRGWLKNTGPTPAHDVSYNAHADILPFPLPDDFTFPLPSRNVTSAGTVNSQQQFILSAFVDRLISDEEIAEIKLGAKKRLYIYGTINYKDAFDNTRYTNFSFSIAWLKDGIPISHNTKFHNDAN